MRALFVQQDHVSPVGPIGEQFERRGYDVEEFLVVDQARHQTPNVEVVFPDPARYDAIVPMGAPWSVYDEARIGNWLVPELRLLAAAHDVGVPVLGICFGGQALASALGGSVAPAGTTELGWVRVDTDDADLIEPGPWFEWHYDRWTSPPGATEIARSPVGPQAFTIGRSLAVQFHPEITTDMLVGWNANGGAEFLVTHGLDPAELLARTRREEPAAVERSHRLVDRFVDRIATRAITVRQHRP